MLAVTEFIANSLKTSFCHIFPRLFIAKDELLGFHAVNILQRQMFFWLWHEKILTHLNTTNSTNVKESSLSGIFSCLHLQKIWPPLSHIARVWFHHIFPQLGLGKMRTDQLVIKWSTLHGIFKRSIT